jgi:hypothetical protein
MKSSFRLRLLRWIVIVSVIPSILIGTFSYFMISKEIQKDTERLITNVNEGIYNMIDTQQRVLNQWLLSAADSFGKKIDSLGEHHIDYNDMVQVGEYYLPTWYIGNQKITMDYTLVDELIETERLPASIFMLVDNEFVRVSTNVRQADGNRITATKLRDEPVYERLINGQVYLGRANVEGIMHATIYVPIFDDNKNLIGAYVLGRKEREYELINAIKRITIGEEGYVMIMDTKGDVIIHPKLTGENVIEYDWIQKIITKQEGYIEYNFEGYDKIAYFKYFEPWDWYIVSIGLYDDIYGTSLTLSRMLILIIALSLVISSVIAYKISNDFFIPIFKLMESLKRLKNGDLSSRFTSYEDEEFKFLSNTFNSMSYTLSILLGRIIATSNRLKQSSETLLNDFERSRDSLENIEKTVEDFLEKLNSSDINKQKMMAYKIIEDIKVDVKIMKEDLPDFISETLNNDEYIGSLNQLEEKIASIDCYFEDYNLNQKINYLYIEIQKMKLLLLNIFHSASNLDDIANEVDSQANLFKIDRDPYED